MLTLKELENRMYLDKTCMYFTYNLRNEKKKCYRGLNFPEVGKWKINGICAL